MLATCLNCGYTEHTKCGHNRAGVQIWKCIKCGKTHVEDRQGIKKDISESLLACPVCGNTRLWKGGVNSQGTPIHVCSVCRKKFVESTAQTTLTADDKQQIITYCLMCRVSVSQMSKHLGKNIKSVSSYLMAAKTAYASGKLKVKVPAWIKKERKTLNDLSW